MLPDLPVADPQHEPVGSLPARSSWMGGQGIVPKEQNTQQSPAFGFNSAPQPLQSYKNWQESVGIVSVARWPHSGQVIVDRNSVMRSLQNPIQDV